MKKLKITATAIVLTVTAGQASALTLDFNQNWGFNPQVGGSSLLTPIDEMTYLGVNYTETSDDLSTFQSLGRIGATGFQNDGSNIPGGVSGLGVNYSLPQPLSTGPVPISPRLALVRPSCWTQVAR